MVWLVAAVLATALAVTVTVVVSRGAVGRTEEAALVTPPWPSQTTTSAVIEPPSRTLTSSPSARAGSPAPAGTVRVVAALFLLPGERLLAGHAARSVQSHSLLLLRPDGEVVLHHDGAEVWSTQTGGHPGATLVMQPDGDLVLSSPATGSLWSTGTSGNPGAYLTVHDDGYLSVRSATDRRLWQTPGTIDLPVAQSLG
jgi:hypothetical protein